MVDIKNVLTRKFLSLREADLRAQPQLEGAFLHAIATSGQRGHFSMVFDFHGIFFNAYSTISSFAYIIYSSPENAAILTALLCGLIAINTAVFFHRLWGLVDYGQKYTVHQKAAAEYTYHTLRDWRRIRAAGREEQVSLKCATLRNTYNFDDFWMWLYAVRTDKLTTTLTEALVCLSWGIGYQLTRDGAAGAAPTIPTGNLLTLLSALYSFNFATQRIFTLLSKVTRHSFDIEETANLMNLDEGRDVSHEAATGNGTLLHLPSCCGSPRTRTSSSRSSSMRRATRPPPSGVGRRRRASTS